MKKIIILISIIFLFILSCDNRLLLNPVDPESELYTGEPSLDNDNDGIGQYEDVDEIQLVSPELGETISQDNLVLTVNKFNPDVISKYWIQIASDESDFDGTIVYEKK